MPVVAYEYQVNADIWFEPGATSKIRGYNTYKLQGSTSLPGITNGNIKAKLAQERGRNLPGMISP